MSDINNNDTTNYNKEKLEAIRRKNFKKLAASAHSGNITSMFQLYQSDRKGEDTGLEAVLIEKYFQNCVEYLTSVTNINGNESHVNKLHLKSLNLIDFRKFTKLVMDFDEQLTVYIGNNGAGKTSIAYSIARTLSWLSAGLEKEGKHGKGLTKYDANINCDLRAEVHSKISLGKSISRDTSLFKYVKGVSDGVETSYLEELRSLSDLYRVINDSQKKVKKPEINLPLFAFYSVERSHLKSNKSFDIEKLSNIDSNSRFDAYDGALDGAGKFGDFLEWFLILDNLANPANNPELGKLKRQIVSLEKAATDDDPVLKKMLADTKKEYKAITDSGGNSQFFAKQLGIVKQAIIDITPSVSDIFVDRSSGRAELKVNNDHAPINIYQASQGQQILVALAADLSRRLVMLNPNSETPLSGQGIVVIDEVELHLHPQWQQTIIQNLLNTFPNIQFIITTHSPQVLSTVDKSKIRKFDKNAQGEDIISIPKFQTKGVNSLDILSQIMDTNSTPDVVEAEWVNVFSSLLIDKKKSEADKVLEKIVKHFGKDHPVVNDCLNQIKISEMKTRLSISKGKNV
jgi:predicted ATP-binding protein involved in virulence